MGLRETARALETIGFREIYLKERLHKRKEDKSDKAELLRRHFDSFKDCAKCELHRNRTQVVFGDGNPYSPVVFVGEAPGEDEDRQGRPFVGRAGKYLNKKIEEVLGLRREEVYITNVCKCRPPGNRKPTPAEISACFPYLKKEIDIIKPKVICCLGATAGEGILGKKLSITKVRGKNVPYPYDPSITVLLTYHPAYILRNPRADGEFTEDMERLKELIGL
ncbi:uracil-DNA glycosylase [Hydrogenivirga sp. 128-5-R1-1]|uniref:uracil-DNA glycosylase n=1 Tax=Hydrogenivirga sp. 128-5-R1-1 TaxID=392423 RepID=UPI00015EF737|nr:uracil-DNA glycosylase [Hydrogenivirga sp. 128-5-R1-1]EDP75650.1 N-terminus of phage SPO1 DNA polymerase [Hydrogenivirga sp. 128-5-R1-1]